MGKKTCIKCNISKDITEFHKNKANKDGHLNICKICKSIYSKEYHKTYTPDPDKVVKRRNSQKYKEGRAKYLIDNAEKIKEQRRIYKIKYRAKIKQDPFLHTKNKLRKRTAKAFSVSSWNKHNTTKDILGCSYEEAFSHLERLFAGGMTWDNRDKWHIDHIIPLSSAKTEEELIKLCHYTNLQPLWAEDNLKKGSKII